MKDVQISTPTITLGAFLKFSGVVSSGSEAKELVALGKVLVNGEVCVLRGKKLYNGDTITANQGELRVVCE